MGHYSRTPTVEVDRALSIVVAPRGDEGVAQAVGEKGCVIEVTAAWPLNVAVRWIRSTKLSDGNLSREDRAFVLNTYYANNNDEFEGIYLSRDKGSKEELCYRTSFSLTFLENELEIDNDTCIVYSAHVVIVRDNFDDGQAWLDLSQSHLVDNVSIISISVNPKPVLTHTTLIRYQYIRSSGYRATMEEYPPINRRSRAYTTCLELAGLRATKLNADERDYKLLQGGSSEE